MTATHHESGRPIQVVLFGSGPKLNPDVKEFLCRLEDHPDITLAGAYFQAKSSTWGAAAEDLWRRRRLLAPPLLCLELLNATTRAVFHRRAEMRVRAKLARLVDRMHFVPDVHAPAVLDEIGLLKPDLGLVYGSPILKPVLFEKPRLGTLGIHHGKVPEYRGNKTTFWAMYNGEPFAGVTIQQLNAGLDTGSIVKEGQVPIGRRSQRTVRRELEALGLDLYLQAIVDVKDGRATYRPQTGRKGKLYRNPRFLDLVTFWRRRAKRHLSWRDANTMSRPAS